ncbi:MAG: NAD(P)/FAD-dependent oxidoreductase [Desulfococcaceae bacterium]
MFGKPIRAWESVPPPAEAEAVIVGGGVHGLSTAYFLAESRQMRPVALLEAGWIGCGNSGRSLGILRADPPSSQDLTGDGEELELWRGLLGKRRLTELFYPCGLLSLAHGPAEMAEMRSRAVAGRLMGLKTALLDPLACRELVPALDVTDRPRHPVSGGLYHRSGGVIRADRAIWELARDAAGKGVAIGEGVAVREITVRGGRVVSVETAAGPIRTPRVLVAAGTGSAELVRSVGVSLPLGNEQISALAGWPIQPLLEVALISDRYGLAAAQSYAGEIWLGGRTGSLPPDSLGRSPSETVPEDLAASAVEILPCLAGVAFPRRWAGRVDRTPDGRPIVDGNVAAKGLFIDCGWGGLGFQPGPLTGRRLADFMATGRKPESLAPFSLFRFMGKPRHSAPNSANPPDDAAGAFPPSETTA